MNIKFVLPNDEIIEIVMSIRIPEGKRIIFCCREYYLSVIHQYKRREIHEI